MKRLAGLILSLAALMVSGLPAPAQKQGGTLRLYQREDPPSASIHEEATISTVFPFMAVFNNLVMYDPQKPKEGKDTVVPDLAESWALDDAGTKLTFMLRQGVTWHDGKAFTAKDVVCTFGIVDGSTAGARKSPRKVWYDNVEKVVADDALRVIFHLKAPQPGLLVLLASGQSPIYPCHVPPRDMRTAPVGTGPFKFVEYKRGQSVRLERNAAYWKPGRPYLDAIELRIIASRSTRILAFIAGEFDMTFVADVSIPLIKDIAARAPAARCELVDTGIFVNVMVNRTTPPFDNPKIREAMSLALDRQAFVDIVGEGKLTIGGTMIPLPDGHWGMPPEVLASLPGYGANVEQSRVAGRKLMEGLGYSKERPLKVRLVTRNLDDHKNSAIILVDQLRSVHIAADLFAADSSLFYNIMQKKDYTIGTTLSGSSVDHPDAYLTEHYLCKSERNYTNYCNPEVDRLIGEQMKEGDPARRKALVWQIERKLVEDVARPVIFHQRAGTCYWPHVKGITVHQNSQFNQWRFEDVWLDR